jgi:hypothetical protein
MRTAGLLFVLLMIGVRGAAAQDIGVYLTGGTGSIDYLVHREVIPQASVGVVWRLAGERLRLGGEADVFTSNGYVSGRGGPVAEITLLRAARIQPFVKTGYFYGEDRSWVAGGGVDFWLTERSGIRVLVQDAFRPLDVRGSPGDHPRDVFHEPSFQIGWTWR